MAGEGSVCRRVRARPNGTTLTRWIAQLSRGGRESRKYQTESHLTRKEAAAALDRMRADRAERIQPSGQSLGKFLRTWIDETARPTISANTYRGYSAVLTHLEPIAEIPLRELTAEDIERCLNRMTAQRKNQRVAAPAATRTILLTHRVLRTALDVAVTRGHVRRNEARLVKLRPIPRGDVAAMTPELARAVLAAIDGDRYEAGYALGFCALRASEVLGLRWSELDLDRGYAHVTKQLVGSGLGAGRAKTKTPKSATAVRLPPFVIDRLRAHKLRQLEERARSGKETKEGLVLVTPKGYAVNLSWYSKHFKALLAAAELPEMRLHDMRHGTVSLLAGAGLHPRLIQEYGRWASSRTPMDIYTHATAGQVGEAADMLQRLVAG